MLVQSLLACRHSLTLGAQSHLAGTCVHAVPLSKRTVVTPLKAWSSGHSCKSPVTKGQDRSPRSRLAAGRDDLLWPAATGLTVSLAGLHLPWSPWL